MYQEREYYSSSANLLKYDIVSSSSLAAGESFILFAEPLLWGGRSADLPPQSNGSAKSMNDSPAASDDDDTMSYFSKLAEDE